MASPAPNGIVCYATSTLTLTRCPTNLSILILTVTADATLNAQDLTLLQSIHHVLHVIVPSLSFSPSPGRPSPRVLILTAEGSRRFIGAIIPELLLNADRAAGVEASRIGQENANALERGLGNNIVTIAAVNGTVIGGGLDMMLACDFAVADTRARFRQAEVLGGVIPAFGGSWRLTRAIGKGRARYMATTGQSVDARKARDWGLVLGIVDAALEQQGQLGVLGEALVLAQHVCLAQEGAVRKVKAVMVQTADNGADCAMMVEREAFGSRMGSGEVQFGMEALIRARNASSVSP